MMIHGNMMKKHISTFQNKYILKKNKLNMKNIKNFNDYITEELLFSHGGNIGGEHKKPVSDEDIESGKVTARARISTEDPKKTLQESADFFKKNPIHTFAELL